MTRTVSALFGAAQTGDTQAAEALFAALYAELHRVARRELARSRGTLSLSPTTILHQAYIDMAGRDGMHFPDRARFVAYAARVMRGLIIDHARRRHALKRGAGFEITAMRTGTPEQHVDDRELVRLSDALDELVQLDPALVEVVDLRFFCGFTFEEIAELRAISERTVRRQWEKARICLHHSLSTTVMD